MEDLRVLPDGWLGQVQLTCCWQRCVQTISVTELCCEDSISRLESPFLNPNIKFRNIETMYYDTLII